MALFQSGCIGMFLFFLHSAVFAGDEFAAPEALVNDANSQLFEEIPSVYSASKYEQKTTKAPASISIVTADEIKKWGYRTFGDIVASLKGFYNTSDRTNGFVGTRGFGLAADYNTRLLLLIDGHRFNNNILESFDTSEGFPVDIDVIERIEVVRGPSSSLYGSSAFFGVVNVITKRGRDQQGFNVKGSYGNNDAYKTSVSHGERFNNGLETFVSGSFFNSQGNQQLYYPEFDNPASNNGMSVNHDEELAKKLLGKMTFGDFSFQGLYVNRKKDIPTASYLTAFNADENVKNESSFLELKYDHIFTNQLNVQSRISYNNFRETGDYPYLQTGGGLVVNKDLFRGQWWRYELEASKLVWQDHRLTAGGQYQVNFDQFLTNYDKQTYIKSAVSTDQWALFIQDDYAISDALTFSAGLRYDYFSVFGDTLNPRLGLIYNPWQTSSIKLLYGTAFRAPSQSELNYNDAGISTLPSGGLKPEQLETVEFILEHQFNSHLRAELNLFHSDITDVISLNPVNDDLVQNQNSGNVESNGLEIQLEDNWENGFQSRISYSWQGTQSKENSQRLTNSPEHMVKLNLITPLWTDKLFLGFETQYMSQRKTVSGGHVDDYVLSNITLFTQKWLPGVELSSSVYNLFDQRYYDPGSSEHQQNVIQQDGLTFRVKASVDF